MNKLARNLRKTTVTSQPYASAGVLLAYKFREVEKHSILFITEKRRGGIKYNFPLGKIEKFDDDAITTALREFNEETNGKLLCLSDYLECKLRTEYPSNSLYVTSGRSYLFFVDLSNTFGLDQELLQLSEDQLQNLVSSKLDEMTQERIEAAKVKEEQVAAKAKEKHEESNEEQKEGIEKVTQATNTDTYLPNLLNFSKLTISTKKKQKRVQNTQKRTKQRKKKKFPLSTGSRKILRTVTMELRGCHWIA
eukprot:TRINITY_DN8775_c0_g1_i1.p1 TRINITY_DN8775_c0_g1~~TRINITY_DN8775_c0_g1_i1.p1  ORF type:complete len:250 (+),score=50.83 TRINITY_DN8775_c0_g1_i1:6-755(+)